MLHLTLSVAWDSSSQTHFSLGSISPPVLWVKLSIIRPPFCVILLTCHDLVPSAEILWWWTLFCPWIASVVASVCHVPAIHGCVHSPVATSGLGLTAFDWVSFRVVASIHQCSFGFVLWARLSCLVGLSCQLFPLTIGFLIISIAPASLYCLS